jgi:hypothetical protein
MISKGMNNKPPFIRQKKHPVRKIEAAPLQPPMIAGVELKRKTPQKSLNVTRALTKLQNIVDRSGDHNSQEASEWSALLAYVQALELACK